MVTMHIDIRLFIWLFLSFICATVAGTIMHELGHYVVAESLGYDAQIHYGSTSIISAPVDGKPSDRFWITSGGPIQTMLTGSFGLVLMFMYRKSFFISKALLGWQWGIIFISLFWLRQAANFATWLGSFILKGRYSDRGDEIKLAKYLGIADWTILSSTGIIGLIALAIIVLKIVPVNQRLTFMAAGLFGGIAGYIIWLNVLGQILIP